LQSFLCVLLYEFRYKYYVSTQIKQFVMKFIFSAYHLFRPQVETTVHYKIYNYAVSRAAGLPDLEFGWNF